MEIELDAFGTGTEDVDLHPRESRRRCCGAKKAKADCSSESKTPIIMERQMLVIAIL